MWLHLSWQQAPPPARPRLPSGPASRQAPPLAPPPALARLPPGSTVSESPTGSVSVTTVSAQGPGSSPVSTAGCEWALRASAPGASSVERGWCCASPQVVSKGKWVRGGPWPRTVPSAQRAPLGAPRSAQEEMRNGRHCQTVALAEPALRRLG